MFVTITRGTVVRLSIIPLNEIRPHERTIPSLLSAIRNDMRRTGYQRDPILVDRRTHLALDGMHRLESLRSLGAKYGVCAEFDYSDESVKIERWLRTMIAPSRKLVSTIIAKFEMDSCSNLQTAIRRVETGRSGIALLSSRESCVGGTGWNISDLYRKIGEVDVLCEKSRTELQFSRESEKFNLFSSESVVTIFPKRLSKNDVLRIARRNELLPYKTTRYFVPVRPMGIYFPISFLRNRSLSECGKKLRQLVNLSKVILEKRNVWYEGRRYSERLAIFRQDA